MRYLVRRLVYFIVIFVGVTFSVSLLVEFLPGDPATALLGEDATQAQIDAMRQQLHLDTPIVQRYWDWLWAFAHGDLGESLRTGRPVMETILQRLPVTLELVIAAQILALAYAVPAGMYGAYRSGSIVDRATRFGSSVVISVPNFLLAVFAVQFFAVKFKLVPVTGFTPITEDLANNLRSIILPAIAIAAEPAGVYHRLLRTDIAATLREDYIAFARAKGLPPRYVLARHAMRPSSFSIVTLAGIKTAQLIGGSIIVEIIFALPGIGRYIIDGISGRDIVAVQGVVALVTVSYLVINTAVDLIYGVLDPRVRERG